MNFLQSDTLLLSDIKEYYPDVTIENLADKFFKYVSVNTRNKNANNVLGTFALFPTTYSGELDAKSIWSCTYCAEKLGDSFDVSTKSTTYRKYFMNDYFGTIAKELNNGRICVAFGQNWILNSFVEYLIAGRADIRFLGESLSVKIYRFYDDTFKVDNAEVRGENTYMIFANVNVADATRISQLMETKLNPERSFYHLNFSGPRLDDIMYLYPLNKIIVETVPALTFVESDVLSREQIEELFDNDRLVFSPEPRINDLHYAYASWLLAEASSFEYPISWQNGKLYIEDVGYVQGGQLYDVFKGVATTLVKNRITYQKFDNFAAVGKFLVNNEELKAFYYRGVYYAALPGNFVASKTDTAFTDPDIGETLIEIKNPLRYLNFDYLSILGYDTSVPEDSNKPFNIKLEHKNERVPNESGAEVSITNYFYKPTYGGAKIVHSIDGGPDRRIGVQLQLLLNFGYFFTRRMSNIMRTYPNFIPSYQPILDTGLSDDRKILNQELTDILFNSDLSESISAGAEDTSAEVEEISEVVEEKPTISKNIIQPIIEEAVFNGTLPAVTGVSLLTPLATLSPLPRALAPTVPVVEGPREPVTARIPRSRIRRPRTNLAPIQSILPELPPFSLTPPVIERPLTPTLEVVRTPLPALGLRPTLPRPVFVTETIVPVPEVVIPLRSTNAPLDLARDLVREARRAEEARAAREARKEKRRRAVEERAKAELAKAVAAELPNQNSLLPSNVREKLFDDVLALFQKPEEETERRIVIKRPVQEKVPVQVAEAPEDKPVVVEEAIVELPSGGAEVVLAIEESEGADIPPGSVDPLEEEIQEANEYLSDL